MKKSATVAGARLDYLEHGAGRPLLFLHAGEGLMPERPWLARLARDFRVIAPWHPGYGESPPLEGGGSVEDLAYLYLDMAAALGLAEAVLVGACLGGWVAVEIMIRSTARFSHLVLADPLGVKFGGREERGISDIFALPRSDYLRLAWADPQKGMVDYAQMPDEELTRVARGREAFARYGWKPYMHNPRLPRWLHRIDRPTLILWGAADGIIAPNCGEGWRRAIPEAQLEVINGAGHFPHWEQPEIFAGKIARFVAGAER